MTVKAPTPMMYKAQAPMLRHARAAVLRHARALTLGLALLAPPAAAAMDRAAPPDLPTQISQALSSVARERGKEGLRLDPRLSAAAAALLPYTTDSGPPPPADLVNLALHREGIIEPSPSLLLSAYSPGDEAGLLASLKPQLTASLAEGRWRRLGVAVAPPVAGRVRLALLLLESFIQLDDPPRSLPAGAEVTLRGAVLAPYVEPELVVTDPSGQVARLPVRPGKASRGQVRFTALLRCLARGVYQVEVLGHDRSGPTVLANFPVGCGAPLTFALPAPPSAPRTASAQQKSPAPRAGEPVFRDAADAEAQLYDLLNADRARAGLPRLTRDDALAAVARGHSGDMRDHDFVGHVSPRSGDARARLHRAKIGAQILLENLARAYSPQEAERGLLDSPGHRANIMNPSVSHVGIGVALTDPRDGVRDLFVTQLFARPAERFDAVETPRRALRRLQALRGRQPALIEDAALRALAQQALQALTGKGSDAERSQRGQQLIQEGVQRLAERFGQARTLLLTATEIDKIESASVKDPSLTHIGLAAEPAPGPEAADSGAVLVVAILAQQR